MNQSIRYQCTNNWLQYSLLVFPRHPNTWQGTWTPKTHVKHLRRGYDWMSRYSNHHLGSPNCLQSSVGWRFPILAFSWVKCVSWKNTPTQDTVEFDGPIEHPWWSRRQFNPAVGFSTKKRSEQTCQLLRTLSQPEKNRQRKKIAKVGLMPFLFGSTQGMGKIGDLPHGMVRSRPHDFWV